MAVSGKVSLYGVGIGVFFFVNVVGGVSGEEVRISMPESQGPATQTEMIEAPGLGEAEWVQPLAEVMDRISPVKDGWDTEAFSEAASEQLYRLKAIMGSAEKASTAELSSLSVEGFECLGLRPTAEQLKLVHEGEFEIKNWDEGQPLNQSQSLIEAMQGFRSVFAPDASVQLSTKLYKVQAMEGGEVVTDVLVEAAGDSRSAGRCQVNAQWRCYWQDSEEGPLLTKIELTRYEEVSRIEGEGLPMFSDHTQVVLGGNASFERQILRSTDHWRARLSADLGLDVVANVGLMLADLNGDGLEDVYLCQQGGLPNLLFLRQSDGTMLDVSEESGADWMDFTSCALGIDLDNDGDRDLVVAMQFQLILMRNDGGAKFEQVKTIPLSSQTFSISAADYDLDGDLDIYTCGYNASLDELGESGALGSPLPFHDANNGGRNTFLQNNGAFSFSDVTKEVGFDQNNRRFSFAAGWEDFDRDGDPDLYVANDYGRNNLYRNDEGKFVDVAKELVVEDMSSGMSVSWGDYNRDGTSDLYVSNMFSSAGNRVTFQKQFQGGVAADALPTFKRFARGNTLFEADGQGGFKDVSLEAGATMARWAWGSRFADLDNDGWEDILVANGFISTPDTGDL